MSELAAGAQQVGVRAVRAASVQDAAEWLGQQADLVLVDLAAVVGAALRNQVESERARHRLSGIRGALPTRRPSALQRVRGSPASGSGGGATRATTVRRPRAR